MLSSWQSDEKHIEQMTIKSFVLNLTDTHSSARIKVWLFVSTEVASF